MTEQFEFDHLSIGVRDPLAVAQTLRRELGSEPLTGGVLPDFRYLLMHVGDVLGERVVGGRLELIATPEHPQRRCPGFMHRFLERHGEAAHHLSFNVPEISSVREALHAAGFRTVKEDLEFPSWQELFLPPDALHGVLIQIASTPKPIRTRDLFGTTERDWSTLPNNRDGADPGWWEELWEVPVPKSGRPIAPDVSDADVGGDRAVLGSVVLGTEDLDRSDVLFRQILHGAPNRIGRELQPRLSARARGYTWPTGSILVVEGEPGVRGAACVPRAHPPAGGGDRAHERDRRVGTVRLSSELEDLL